MTTREGSTAWDLSPVLELVNTLSYLNSDAGRGPENEEAEIGDAAERVKARDVQHSGDNANLGDFAKIWQYLGVAAAPVANVSSRTSSCTNEHHAFTSKHDYTSDGAVRYGLRPREQKTVTWRDDNSIDDVAPGSSPEREAMLNNIAEKLTKAQRKKKNRKDRKAKEAAHSTWTVSESEADNVFLQTPARKASLHVAVNGRGDHKDLPIPPRSTPGKVTEVSDVPKLDHSMRQTSQPELITVQTDSVLKKSNNSSSVTQWPITPKAKIVTNGFLPSTVSPRQPTVLSQRKQGPNFPSDTLQAVQAVQNARAELQSSTPPHTLPIRAPLIEPKIVRSGEDRHWALLLKLINDFQPDRKSLVSPMNMTTHNNDPKGLHVFVDASNIFIGFNDQLKRSRNIPLTTRVPAVDLSFDALALLMERRRPVAKRSLVGSSPHLPAFDKAKSVGYDCSILEKVYKARELTERQIYFRDRDNRSKWSASKEQYSDGGGYSSGGGSTSEPATKQYAPARMIEQGVDELLHMKMAQSLLDYDEPATMVVATGDAAQAEYSDGFKAMIERALRKGWTVELVSWSKNISSLYLRKDFQTKWQDRFRIIYLDDYAEELLDM